MPTLADEVGAGRAISQLRFRDDAGATALGPALATGGTIPTAEKNRYRFTTAGAVTGILMAKGIRDGQIMILTNTSANSATFASSATSFVDDGANISVGANRSILLIWSVVDALWSAIESS